MAGPVIAHVTLVSAPCGSSVSFKDVGGAGEPIIPTTKIAPEGGAGEPTIPNTKIAAESGAGDRAFGAEWRTFRDE